jgi:hypothetical protein
LNNGPAASVNVVKTMLDDVFVQKRLRGLSVLFVAASGIA